MLRFSDFVRNSGCTHVARVAASFTEKLNINDDPESASKTKEIWLGFEVAGTEIGNRTKVSDETLVQLLLASDASIATYLTLAYQGDDNPITTIYKDLPIASLSSDGSGSSLSNYFRSVTASTSEGVIEPNTLTNPNNWYPNGSNIYYTNGWVGIGATVPEAPIHLKKSTPNFKLTTTRSTGGVALSLFDAGISNAGGSADWIKIGVKGNADTRAFEYLFIGDAWNDNAFRAYGNKNAYFGGNVGIGTTEPGGKLDVAGRIRCTELVVATVSNWADFVFEDHYKLPPLNEVEDFISKNRHLPGIPSEAEVKEKGINVGNVSSKLLQKIEELTLYLIDIKKENDKFRAQLTNLEDQLKEIKD